MLEIPSKYTYNMLPLRMSWEDKLCQSMLWIAVLGKSVLVSMLLESVTDATSPNSMGLCLGRKPEKPNEQALLECYQKRRNRQAQLSTKQVSLIGCQQKMKDQEGASTRN